MKTANIIIVEDEKTILDSVSQSLRIEYNTVYKAKNGIEALEIISKHQIDVVITDLNMPKMCGNDLIKNLILQGKTLPIIILSAYSEALESYRNFRNITALNKPYNMQELINKIEYFITGEYKRDIFDKIIESCDIAKRAIDRVKKLEKEK